MTSSNPKKAGIPDSGNDIWKTVYLGSCDTGSTIDIAGASFNLNLADSATAGTIPPSENQQIIDLLTDIWHNQATIIKWLSKIAENTKHK